MFSHASRSDEAPYRVDNPDLRLCKAGGKFIGFQGWSRYVDSADGDGGLLLTALEIGRRQAPDTLIGYNFEWQAR